MPVTEEEFLPKSGGLGFKKAAREVYSKVVDKVQELNKINPDMTFLVDWNSVLNLPTDLKWTARREELDAPSNVLLYLKFSWRINYLCEEIPKQFVRDPDCKEAFMGLKKMILHIQHNPNDTQSNGCNPNSYSVKGDELHVTLEGNLPELMREANDGSNPSLEEEITRLTNAF